MRNVAKHVVVLLALPHYSTEDDVYKGYFIPKGSIVVANSWCVHLPSVIVFSSHGCYRAILHDEKHYPDPFTFNPDRYFRPDGTFDPNVLDPSVAAFGYGRRVCAGRWMAQDSMWIAIACMLAVFTVGKKKDRDRKEMTPSGEYQLGFLWCVPTPGSR